MTEATGDFIRAIEQVSAEKGVPAGTIVNAIESALVSVYRRNYGSPHQAVAVRLDRHTGAVRVVSPKSVVMAVQDPAAEIGFDDARAIKPEAALGSTLEVDVTPINFGRIAAQTAKQVVQQRLREAEREQVFDEFVEREGEIITGQVSRTDARGVVVDLGRAEAVLPPIEQMPGEHYRPQQRMKFLLVEVQRTPKGLQIILSRTHRNLIRRLFELEVPEIYNGVVEIKAIAREPGSRSKVAVHARQPGVDPVGSCVGPRGARIQAVVGELGGEKVDVVEWHADPAVFVAKALSPAQVIAVDLRELEKTAVVTVLDRQLSLAIGREGQNARLAAKLTGWRIDIKGHQSGRAEERPAAAVGAGSEPAKAADASAVEA